MEPLSTSVGLSAAKTSLPALVRIVKSLTSDKTVCSPEEQKKWIENLKKETSLASLQNTLSHVITSKQKKDNKEDEEYKIFLMCLALTNPVFPIEEIIFDHSKIAKWYSPKKTRNIQE